MPGEPVHVIEVGAGDEAEKRFLVDQRRQKAREHRFADVAGGPPTMLLAAVVAVLLFASAAAAYETPPKLNDVARLYSLGAGEVRCASEAEWKADFGASFGWGYTNVRDEISVLGPLVCEGALNVGNGEVPAWQEALGVLVVAHEAFHLRRWRFRRHEGKVECQAIVHFKDAAQRLGASQAHAEDLYPYALALHERQLRLFPPLPRPGMRRPALESAVRKEMNTPAREGARSAVSADRHLVGP